MLRHIGVSKRQIIAMLASEGGLLGLVGGIAGIFLGGIMAQVLVHVINPQSFNWTMATRVPWGIVASVAAALVVAAAGTATIAGRRAIAADAGDRGRGALRLDRCGAFDLGFGLARGFEPVARRVGEGEVDAGFPPP